MTSTNGDSWTFDEILDRIDTLSAALVGAGAGWAVGSVASGLAPAQAEWMAKGSSPDANRINAILALGLAGATVTDVQNRGLQIHVAELCGDLDEQSLMSGLVGLFASKSLEPETAIRLIDGRGVVIFDFDAGDLTLAASELETHGALAAFRPFVSSQIRLGRDPSEVLQEMIAGQLMIAGAPVINAFVEKRPVATVAGALADDLDFMISVAERWEALWSSQTHRLIRRLLVLQRHAYRSAAGTDAKDHLRTVALDLFRWADGRSGSLLPET